MAPDEIARAVIDANRFMTLATADPDGVPWATPVWYATEGYREFFWISNPRALHSRNLARRPQVGIVIFDSHEPGGWKSVYISAVAEELTGDSIDHGIRIFSAQSQAQGLREWSGADVREPAQRRLYRATAAEHFVLSPEDERIPVTLAAG